MCQDREVELSIQNGDGAEDSWPLCQDRDIELSIQNGDGAEDSQQAQGRGR